MRYQRDGRCESATLFDLWAEVSVFFARQIFLFPGRRCGRWTRDRGLGASNFPIVEDTVCPGNSSKTGSVIEIAVSMSGTKGIVHHTSILLIGYSRVKAFPIERPEIEWTSAERTECKVDTRFSKKKKHATFYYAWCWPIDFIS